MSDPRESIVLELCARWPNVEAIYLFGSRARGEARTDSDWDVAFLRPRVTDSVERWEVQERIASALSGNVDLVDLRAASTVMRTRVLRDGQLLYEAAPRARAEFEMYALSDYSRLQEERLGILLDAQKPGWLYG